MSYTDKIPLLNTTGSTLDISAPKNGRVSLKFHLPKGVIGPSNVFKSRQKNHPYTQQRLSTEERPVTHVTENTVRTSFDGEASLSNKVSGVLSGLQDAVMQASKDDALTSIIFDEVRADYSVLKAKFPKAVIDAHTALLAGVLVEGSTELSFEGLRKFISVIPELETHDLTRKDEQFLAIRLGRHLLQGMKLTPDQLCQIATDIADLASNAQLKKGRHKLDLNSQVRQSLALTRPVRPASTTTGKVAVAIQRNISVVTGYALGIHQMGDLARMTKNLSYGRYKQDKTPNKAINWLCESLEMLRKASGSSNASREVENDLLKKCAETHDDLGNSKKAKKLDEAVSKYLGANRKSEWDQIKVDVYFARHPAGGVQGDRS